MLNLNQYKRLDARQKCDPMLGAAAIGAGASLLSGIGSIISGNSANKTNLKIMREQNKFNSVEAKKQRDWQESMYNRFQSPSAQSAQYRAAGLNPQLMGIQNGSVGQGATATAAESATVQPLDYGSVGRAVQQGVDTYQNFADVQLKQSQSSVNDTIKALNSAKTRETRENAENVRLTNAVLEKTLTNQIEQSFIQTNIMKFEQQSLEWKVAQQSFDLLEKSPEEVNNLVAQGMMFYANAYKAQADGDLDYKQIERIDMEYTWKQIEFDLQRQGLALQAEANDIAKEGNRIQSDLNKSVQAVNYAEAKKKYQELYHMKKYNPAKYTKEIQNLGKQGLVFDSHIKLNGALSTYYKTGAFTNVMTGIKRGVDAATKPVEVASKFVP